jgi:hypothetical protein
MVGVGVGVSVVKGTTAVAVAAVVSIGFGVAVTTMTKGVCVGGTWVVVLHALNTNHTVTHTPIKRVINFASGMTYLTEILSSHRTL